MGGYCQKRQKSRQIRYIYVTLAGNLPFLSGWISIAPCTMASDSPSHSPIWAADHRQTLQSGNGGAKEQSRGEEGRGEVEGWGEGRWDEGEGARETPPAPIQEPRLDGRGRWWEGRNVLQGEMQQQGRAAEAPVQDRISGARKSSIFSWENLQQVSASSCCCLAQQW